MNWATKLNNAFCKAQRAINNNNVDPISGYRLDDIIAFIEDCPIGCETDSNAIINRINALLEDERH